MDRLTPTQINYVLKDVRSSYRLLALYQKRLLDIVKYVANGYNVSFNSGWSKFSNPASHGNRASINKSSWDWLFMYLYEFNLGEKNFIENKYYFKIVHQADTGFYDVSQEKNIGIDEIDQFGDVSSSTTRLFFVLSKNENGCPIEHILKNKLSVQNQTELVNGNWLAMPYDMISFLNQESTDLVIASFNELCKKEFGVDLLNVKNLSHDIA
jgi:hypothetical protein